MATECTWCKPDEELCGTCERFFHCFGCSDDKCGASFNEDTCSYYIPINYCPNCGRKLGAEDGK